MAIIVTRSGKGSPLTNNEVDANFVNLNTELETKANTSSLATVATTGAYADLTGKPTIGSADGSIAVTGTTNIDLSVVVAGSTSNVVLPVRNTTGATLTKGTAVYISGATGQISTVSKAIATSDATSAQTLGLVTANIANNANGNVTLIGTITNIDTSAYTDGQQLYLSPTTAGTLTATKPYAPQHLVYIATVEHAHPTQGKLFVKVQNGYEMDELHNVAAQSPANNDGLFYNTSTSLWEKKSIVTALGYTPYNATNPSNYITASALTPYALLSGAAFTGNVTTTGNIGIGTASPASKLQISGSAAGGAIQTTITNTDATGFTGFSFTDGTNTKGQIWVGNGSYGSFGGAGSINYSANSGPHVWHTNYTENMRLSGGNLGLGVIPTTGGYGRGIQISGDPASDLGTLWIQPINTNDHRVSLTNNAKNSGVGTWAYNASSQSATMYEQVAGQHRWFTAGTGTAGSTIAFTQAMTLDANSNLSINKGGNSASITGLGTGQVNFVAYEGTVAFGNSFSGPTIFTTGNTERMRIDGSGNVGIGTSSPSGKLEVTGDITQTWAAAADRFVGSKFSTTYELGLHFLEATRETRIVSKAADSSGLVSIYTGVTPTERMRIDASGNVGIGTSSPATKLDVVGNVLAREDNSAGATPVLLRNSNTGNNTTKSSSALFQGTDTVGTVKNIGSIGFFPDDANYISANLRFLVRSGDATPTERMRIDSSGNVGIGASAPNTKLEVNGGLIAGSENRQTHPPTGPVGFKAQWNFTGGDGETDFYNLYALGTTSFRFYQSTGSGTAQLLYNMRPSSHEFYTGGTERFRITSTGGITSSDLSDAVGYKGLPQNQRTGAYTLALSDIGKHLYVTAGAFAVTIPADATLNFPVGAAITFVCEDAGKTIVPASGVTLVLAGTGAATTGTRTLAIGAVATLIKVQANRWYISGSGVT